MILNDKLERSNLILTSYLNFYVGLPADGSLFSPLLDELMDELGIKKEPDVPLGVMVRQIG